MADGRVNALTIRTPEGIEFSLPLAGPVTRGLAWAVDGACVAALTLLAGWVLSWLSLLLTGWYAAAAVLAYFAIAIGYGMATEWWWRGQTLGKRLLHLRVLDADGLRLQFSQIALRNLLRFVDSLPVFYLVGGLASLLNRRAQRLGDLAANTIVVRSAPVVEPDLRQLLAGKFNSFRNHPQWAARLRQQIAPAQSALALRALLRREEFDPAARVVLFRELANDFRQLAHFPQEATDGLTDEQYVRNVVDLLFRPQGAPGS